MARGPGGLNLGGLRDPLYVNSIFLMANSVVPPALAFFFWLFVARSFTPAMVGQAIALIPMATLLSTAASLGLHIGLVRFLPLAGPGMSGMVRAALTLTGLVALGLAGAFLAGVPLWAPGASPILGDPRFPLGFLVLTEAMALSFVLDSVFIACRRPSYAFLRNTLFGVMRIPLPLIFILLAWVEGFTIFVSYAISALFSLLVALALFLPWVLPGFRLRPTLEVGPLRDAMAFSLGNQISTLAVLLPASLIPIMILNTFAEGDAGLRMAAYFYMAWQGAHLLFIIPNATSFSLLAEGSHGIRDYLLGGRRTLLFTFLLLGPAVAVTFTLGDLFLGFFGPDYVVNGSLLLRLFALSTLPMALLGIYMTSLRLDRRIHAIVAVGVAPEVITLWVGYLLLPSQGLAGIGWGWILGHLLVLAGVTLLDPGRGPLYLLRPLARPTGLMVPPSPWGRDRP